MVCLFHELVKTETFVGKDVEVAVNLQRLRITFMSCDLSSNLCGRWRRRCTWPGCNRECWTPSRFV